MRWRRAGWIVVMAACATLGGVATTRAQQRDPGAAETLFRRGRELMKAGNVAEACDAFAASLEAAPRAGAAMGLADCLERKQDLASAFAHWKEALDLLQPGDERAAYARARVASLDAKLPRLTVRLRGPAPPDTSVSRDGAPLAAGSLGVALPTNPGTHRIVVRARGRADAEVVVSLAEGQRETIEVEVGAAAEAPAAPAPAPPAPPADTAATTRRQIGLVVGGLGVAGVAVAAVTGGILVAKKSAVDADCDRGAHTCSSHKGLDAASSAKPLVTVNAVAWGVGIVGLAAGGTLVLTSLGSRGPRATGAGVAVAGAF